VRTDLAPDRHCENCGARYSPSHPHQRFCNPYCLQEFRNAELRAARRLWVKLGKPQELLEECRDG
jgi:methionyl-tRNA synthetase